MATAQRIRRVDNEKEYERMIDDYITMGYEVDSRESESAHLIKKGKHEKHLMVFLLTFWFTCGIGNLIYAMMPAKNGDDVVIKLERKV